MVTSIVILKYLNSTTFSKVFYFYIVVLSYILVVALYKLLSESCLLMSIDIKLL